MAKVQFSSAWWSKNCAKTLTNSGMEPALKVWEAKKKGEAPAVIKALGDLGTAAVAAEKKANKTLHKATIALLQEYKSECQKWTAKLEKADGSSLATPDKLLTKPVLSLVGSTSDGKMYVNELQYLFVTKGKKNTASLGIYNMFISESAPSQVNLSAPVRKKCDALAKAGTWTDDGWAAAHAEIEKMVFKSSNLAGLKSQVLAKLEREPLLNEIRSL